MRIIDRLRDLFAIGSVSLRQLSRIEARLIDFERIVMEDFSQLQAALDALKAQNATNTDILQRLVAAIGAGNQAQIDALTAEAQGILADQKAADDTASGALNPTGATGA